MLVRNTEGALIGRVSGTITPVFMGMMVIGMSVSGYLKEMFSLGAVYAASGGFILVGAALLLPLVVEKKRRGENRTT